LKRKTNLLLLLATTRFGWLGGRWRSLILLWSLQKQHRKPIREMNIEELRKRMKSGR
jgi:hypothetical protein